MAGRLARETAWSAALFHLQIGPKGGQPRGDVRVPAVDQVAGGDHGLALGAQPGEDQRDSGPQVVGGDLGSLHLSQKQGDAA